MVVGGLYFQEKENVHRKDLTFVEVYPGGFPFCDPAPQDACAQWGHGIQRTKGMLSV